MTNNPFLLPLLESAVLHNTAVSHLIPCHYCSEHIGYGWHGRPDEVGHPECHTDYTMTADELMLVVMI